MDKKKATIPASTWVTRLAFKIRKRGFVAYNDTSLLISNSLGIWSCRRRRYVKKRRFHRFTQLKPEALPVERRYAELRKLGMHSSLPENRPLPRASVFAESKSAGSRQR
jgi:hypothetical protein